MPNKRASAESHVQMAEAGTAASREDARQARLLKRYWAAAGSSLFVLLLMAALYWNGYIEETGFYITAAGILFFVVFYYALFRSGVNRNASDPSLTVAQLLCSILMLTVAMYYTASNARSLILPFVLMAFVFGVFRLSTRKLVYVALFAITCYASMTGLLLQLRPQEVDLRLELLRLMGFGAVLLWFAVMGGYISRLRKTLHDSKVAIEEMATRDALTGVYNRRHLSNVLQQEKSRSDRSGEAFCIGLLDLDFFKAVNDKFGHQAGDEVLKACAKCGEQVVRPIDCFGRYGGEEFEVLLPQTDLEGARIVAERMRSAMSQLRFPHIDPDLRMTVSIGLSQYHPKENVNDAERRADVALYSAKEAGRNRIEIESAAVRKLRMP